MEIAALFLKLGTIGVGGPAAHIALMRDEVVGKRRWLTEAEFLDLVGATNLIPGPNSTELAIHIGRLRAGWPGLLTAGASFILPAFAIVFVLAWAYVEYRTVPQLDAIFYGLKPAIAAVVAVAVAGLARTAISSVFLAVIASSAAILAAAGVHELAVILGGGAIAAAAAAHPRPLRSVALGPIFWFFTKAGSLLFGSGYVLIAYLRGDLVHRWHWLTETELLDAIAIGQITPGPLFTTATFVGYLLAGPAGALTATVGIFLPAFVFVAASGPLIPRLRRSPASARFLDGINAASVGVMAWVLLTLGRSAVTDLATACVALACTLAMWRFNVGSTVVILAAAAFGVLSLLWAA
jgi:chromate transporter